MTDEPNTAEAPQENGGQTVDLTQMSEVELKALGFDLQNQALQARQALSAVVAELGRR